jgi:hypothetical protein
VEICWIAGTVTGWKIIPYNGNGGASYTPIGTLSGIIPNQLNGYGIYTICGHPRFKTVAPDG